MIADECQDEGDGKCWNEEGHDDEGQEEVVSRVVDRVRMGIGEGIGQNAASRTPEITSHSHNLLFDVVFSPCTCVGTFASSSPQAHQTPAARTRQ